MTLPAISVIGALGVGLGRCPDPDRADARLTAPVFLPYSLMFR